MNKKSTSYDENDLFSLIKSESVQPKAKTQIQVENNFVDSQEFRDLYFTRPKDICTLSFGQWFSRAVIHGTASELKNLKHSFDLTITITEAVRLIFKNQLNTQEARKRCQEYNAAWTDKKPR